jgi:hypothetical protein
MGGTRGIRHIEKCDECLEKKAEYLIWSFTFFKSKARLLCKDCSKIEREIDRRSELR